MPIVDHIFNLKGTIVKTVRCENCPTEYDYVAERMARGTVSTYVAPLGEDSQAKEEARRKAESNLPVILASAVDAVPCPVCGWYQSDMIPAARKAFAEWMIVAAVALGFLGCLLVPVAVILALRPGNGISTPAVTSAMVLGLLACPGLLLARLLRCRKYDPNAIDVQTRIRLGLARAIRHAAVSSGQAPVPRPVPARRRLSAEAVGWLVYFLFLAALTAAAAGMAGVTGGLLRASGVGFLGVLVWALNLGLCWMWYEMRQDQLPADQSPVYVAQTGSPADAIRAPLVRGWARLLLLLLGLLLAHGGLVLYIGNKTGAFPTFPFAGGLTLTVGGMLFAAAFAIKDPDRPGRIQDAGSE